LGPGILAILCWHAFGNAEYCHAESLSYIDATQSATINSFDTRIARVQAQEYKADARAAKADYYPTLSTFFAGEFDKGLGSQSAQSLFSVGGTTVNAMTRVQNLLAMQANWTLFDFGARHFNVRAAERSYQAAMLGVDTAVRDMRLQMVELYCQALTAYKVMKQKQTAVTVYRKLFDMKKRTYEAGAISRVDLGEQSLQLAQAEDSIKESREVLTEKLRELSGLTHAIYDVDSVELLDFPQTTAAKPVIFTPQLTPDYRKYALQIASKQAEIHSLLAQKLPKINFYGGYMLYGTNKGNVGAAWQNFGSRLANGGISLQWNAFDGFKNAAERQRKKAEIAELRLQRDKRLWQLQSEYEKANATLTPLGAQMVTKAEIINRGKQKIDMYTRLSDNEISDRTALLTQQVQLLEQNLAADKIRVQQDAAAEKLRILAGG